MRTSNQPLNKTTSSYQRLKKRYLTEKEEQLRDIKTLLDGDDPKEIEAVRQKYKFLINQKKAVLFGKNQSKAARRLNEFLSNNPD